MQNLLFGVVVVAIVIVILASIYFFKGKDIFLNVLKLCFKYFIYVLCVLAQQVYGANGQQKKQFVVNTIKKIIIRVFTKLHIPVRKVDDFLNKYFENGLIENIVQKVYDDHLNKIAVIEQSLKCEIKNDELYKNILAEIGDFND